MYLLSQDPLPWCNDMSFIKHLLEARHRTRQVHSELFSHDNS